jgi:hypothetical protein
VLRAGGQPLYEVDVQQMTQRNLRTGSVRSVQRANEDLGQAGERAVSILESVHID